MWTNISDSPSSDKKESQGEDQYGVSFPLWSSHQETRVSADTNTSLFSWVVVVVVVVVAVEGRAKTTCRVDEAMLYGGNAASIFQDRKTVTR